MAKLPEREGFLKALWLDAKEDFQRYGWVSIIPKAALFSVASGWTIAYLAPKVEFYHKPDIALVFVTAIVTINGLLLALSWTSFAKIYEIASRPKFAAFLRRNDLLDSYFFHVDYIHKAQILALGMSFVDLSSFIIRHIPLGASQFLLGASVSSSVYALINALGAVRILQDLVKYSAIFDEVGDTLSDVPADVISLDPLRQETF